MPRILINECKQEISSFNPVPGRHEDFDIARGEDLLRLHRGIGTEVGGALQIFEAQPDVTLLPGYSCRAITSGGTLAEEAFHRITEEFLESVRAHRDADAIYFCLHGAFAAEGEPDIEGYLLEQTRAIVGERTPIVTSLDLHGIVTDRILRHSDAVVLYHTYPHVDFFETGERSARLLLRLLGGGVRPVTARVEIPALVRGNELKTSTGRFGQCVRECIALENGPGGLSAGMFIGNPFTDVPELCSNVLVVTDNDADRASENALRIAAQFWEMRQHLHQPLTGLRESVEMAARATGRVVLVDAADATSSGASGDSNAILRALLDYGYQRTALIPLVDSPAVAQAVAAGVGATIRVALGGSLDTARFTPVELEARVRILHDGVFRSESHGCFWNGGPTALLQSGNFTLALTSKAVSLYDRSLFYALGQDPAHFDSVVVKSPHCQHHMFDEGAELVINVDAPGSSSANLPSLGHTRCPRPVFPLDADVRFEPRAKIYQRNQ